MAEVEAALTTLLPEHTAASSDLAQRQAELTGAEQQRDALLDKQSRTVQVRGRGRRVDRVTVRAGGTMALIHGLPPCSTRHRLSVMRF